METGLGFLSHLGNSPPSLPFHQSAHRKEKEKLTSIGSEPGQPHALTFPGPLKRAITASTALTKHDCWVEWEMEPLPSPASPGYGIETWRYLGCSQLWRGAVLSLSPQGTHTDTHTHERRGLHGMQFENH